MDAVATPALPPAPWGWECNGPAGSPMGSGFVYLLDANGRKIGTVWGRPAEKVALADMITAAPDMLAALRQCEVDLTEAGKIIGGSGLPATGSILEKSAERVRACIAKAEGRTP